MVTAMALRVVTVMGTGTTAASTTMDIRRWSHSPEAEDAAMRCLHGDAIISSRCIRMWSSVRMIWHWWSCPPPAKSYHRALRGRACSWPCSKPNPAKVRAAFASRNSAVVLNAMELAYLARSLVCSSRRQTGVRKTKLCGNRYKANHKWKREWQRRWRRQNIFEALSRGFSLWFRNNELWLQLNDDDECRTEHECQLVVCIPCTVL